MEDTAKTIGPTRAEEIVLSLSEKLAVTASARNVYGEPIHAHDRIIVPAARFGYGFGATSGGRMETMPAADPVVVVSAQGRLAISRSPNTAHNKSPFQRHVKSYLPRLPESASAICSEGSADRRHRPTEVRGSDLACQVSFSPTEPVTRPICGT